MSLAIIGESGCTLSGTTITLTGTALTGTGIPDHQDMTALTDGVTYRFTASDNTNTSTFTGQYNSAASGTITGCVFAAEVGTLPTSPSTLDVICIGPTGGELVAVPYTITGTGITGTLGELSLCDISGITTADLAYTLPATAAVGDECAVKVTTHAPATIGRELVIEANTGDSLWLAGTQYTATEATRLFIADETMRFMCLAESAGVLTWGLSHSGDGRIASSGLIYDANNTALGDNVALDPTTTPALNLNAKDTNYDVGGIADTTNKRINLRRDCKLSLEISSLTDYDFSPSTDDVAFPGDWAIRNSSAAAIASGKVNWAQNGRLQFLVGVVRSVSRSSDVYIYPRFSVNIPAGATVSSTNLMNASAGGYIFAQEIL